MDFRTRHLCRTRFDLPAPLAFRAEFPVRFSRYCRRMFLSSEELAVFHGVRHRTAERWLEGVNRCSGDVASYAWLYAPDEMRAAMLDDME